MVDRFGRSLVPTFHKSNALVRCSSLRWIGTLILYSLHKGSFDCPGGGLLHSYLVVLLVLLALIILSLCAIVYVSAQGEEPPRLSGCLPAKCVSKFQ